jgi:hypothetical protein
MILPYLHYEPRRWLRVLGVLAQAQHLDQQFNGAGRYEAEAYRLHHRAMDQAWAGLAQFETECAADRDALYATYGPPVRLSKAAQACLGDRDPRATDEAAVAALSSLGSTLAWLECDDLAERPTPHRFGVIQRLGYGAILLDKRARLAYQDVLDSLLEQRIVEVRNALRDLHWVGESEPPQPSGPTRVPPLRRTLKGHVWEFEHVCNTVGAGRNVVSLEYQVVERPPRAPRATRLCWFSDAMRASALDVAALCEQAVQSACEVPRQRRSRGAARRPPSARHQKIGK